MPQCPLAKSQRGNALGQPTSQIPGCDVPAPFTAEPHRMVRESQKHVRGPRSEPPLLP
jgi:hypothetical protein